MVSDERALALQLAGRTDAQLVDAFAARGISASVSWRDFFDAADALLEPASIDRALTRLPRGTLHALAALADGEGADADAVPRRLELVVGTGLPEAVRDRVRRARATAPGAFTARADARPGEADLTHTAAAAERAFTATGALADLLLAAEQSPLAMTAAGAVSANDRRRLMETGIVESAEELDELATIAAAAGLTSGSHRRSAVTEAGAAWLRAQTAERWLIAAERLVAALPAGVRDDDGGLRAAADWEGMHPLDPEWPAQARRWLRVLMRWGVLADDAVEPQWTAALRRGGFDVEPLRAHLPAEIDRVYLQADLSVIAPGPLLPRLELRLRRIAGRESRAQASTYRFSAGSIEAGLSEGETAQSIRAFLTEISLTGIPQPLDYLIESTAARHGAVRVRADLQRDVTVVEVDDPDRRDALAVDQALRPLGLVPEGGMLLSRVGRDAVYWALVDARYPATVIGDDERPRPVRRGTRSTLASPPPPVDYTELIARLRAGYSTDSDAAWLERELEQAVRSRAVIRVSVRMPDGSTRELTLEASGLGGGRLRGRDRAADVERTLPVTSIVSVASAS